MKQFDFRRRWKKDVEPYLHNKNVQFALDFGMSLIHRTNWEWKSGDAPCYRGRDRWDRIVEGKLSWYQPMGQCHEIAFFTFELGKLIYPKLHWKFISGEEHTVPVGFCHRKPCMVMDILCFNTMTAKKSYNWARVKPEGPDSQYRVFYDLFEMKENKK